MSVLLLDRPDKLQDLQDDLESFFYVVLYHALRYMRHNKVNKVNAIIEKVFDDYVEDDDGQITGGDGKRALLNRKRLDFTLLESQPLNDWLQYALDAVDEWITHEAKNGTLSANGNKDLKFHSHRSLDAKWRAVLFDQHWLEVKDGPVDHLAPRTCAKRARDGDPPDLGSPSKKCRTSITGAARFINNKPLDVVGSLRRPHIDFPDTSASHRRKAALKSTPIRF